MVLTQPAATVPRAAGPAWFRINRVQERVLGYALITPVALLILALIAYPFVWLILLPFRIVGIAVGGVLALLSALFFLPARLLRGPRAI